MRIKYFYLTVFFLALMFVLYPFPNTEFLYRNAEMLEGRVTHLKGASFAVFIDPGFYYKFRIAPTDIMLVVHGLGLSETDNKQYYLNVMKKHGPLFWNFWWWRPDEDPASQLYKGNRNGNDFYLLYDRYSHEAYLYIQNT